ncbi:DUF397 domain-containing protein [Streptomyces sp. NPDC058045]|uniref:DUF397 domain-containing protein n=1 Tax=Streptomyces sp. NPDC058045 TaxID=3346311 RepID=UPI0036E4733E
MSDRLAWFRSSYSGTEGGNCLEVALDWRKSSYSNSEGGNCLEVARQRTGTGPLSIHVRDSKLGESSPTFTVEACAWSAFLGATPRI